MRDEVELMMATIRLSIVSLLFQQYALSLCLALVYEDNPLFIDPKGSSSTHLAHYLVPLLSKPQKPHWPY